MQDPYKSEMLKFINGVPYDLEIVNIGSTFSKYCFDYNYFTELSGFNFAVYHQYLYYDYKIIEKYQTHIKNGAIVVVVICPFIFCENILPKQLNRRYYHLFQKEDIPNYRRIDDILVKYIPYILRYNPIVIINKIRSYVTQIFVKRKKLHKDKYINDWLNMFHLTNVKDASSAEGFDKIFQETIKYLQDILIICTDKGFRPIIVSPPTTQEHRNNYSKSFLDKFYYVNIKKANCINAPFFDYFNDNRFNNKELYQDGTYILNEIGRKIFAETIQKDLTELGLLNRGKNE
jgi:hypothetical protein